MKYVIELKISGNNIRIDNYTTKEIKYIAGRPEIGFYTVYNVSGRDCIGTGSIENCEKFNTYEEAEEAVKKSFPYGVSATYNSLDKKLNSYRIVKLIECKDIEVQDLINFVIETREIVRGVLMKDNRPIKNTTKKDVYNTMQKLQKKYISNTINLDDNEFILETFKKRN